MYSDFKEYTEKIMIPGTYIPAVPPIEQIQLLENAKDDVGQRFCEIMELPPIDILEMYGFSDPVKAGILNLYAMWGLSPYDVAGRRPIITYLPTGLLLFNLNPSLGYANCPF